MEKPWDKKNPFVSMWLIGANRLAGSAQARTVSQMKKSAARANKKAIVDTVSVWLQVLATTKAKSKERR